MGIVNKVTQTASIARPVYIYPHLLGLQFPLPLLHGVLLYFYVSSVTDQFPSQKSIVLLHLVPAAITLIYLTSFFNQTVERKIEIFKSSGEGCQINAFTRGCFIITGKAYGIFRHHETALIRMSGFGSEVAVMLGYYKPTWHMAGEFGFDKSINTHLKNSDIIRENYPEVSDGWFVPSGGNF